MRSHAASTTPQSQCDDPYGGGAGVMADGPRLGTRTPPASPPLPYLEARHWIAGQLLLGLSTGWSYALASECTERMAEGPLALALQVTKHYLTTGVAPPSQRCASAPPGYGPNCGATV